MGSHAYQSASRTKSAGQVVDVASKTGYKPAIDAVRRLTDNWPDVHWRRCCNLAQGRPDTWHAAEDLSLCVLDALCAHLLLLPIRYIMSLPPGQAQQQQQQGEGGEEGSEGSEEGSEDGEEDGEVEKGSEEVEKGSEQVEKGSEEGSEEGGEEGGEEGSEEGSEEVQEGGEEGSEEGSGRAMVVYYMDPEGKQYPIFETQATFAGMNSMAAGVGGLSVSPFFHLRWQAGSSLVFTSAVGQGEGNRRPREGGFSSAEHQLHLWFTDVRETVAQGHQQRLPGNHRHSTLMLKKRQMSQKMKRALAETNETLRKRRKMKEFA